MSNKIKRIALNCWKCGRFVGPDGYDDYDAESGEVGYPLCKRCLENRPKTIYDIFMMIRENETVTVEEHDRLDKHIAMHGVPNW